MDDPKHDAKPDTLEAACRQCKRPIPFNAALCSTCGSFQDWRGFLPITSASLAILTALISVTAVAIIPTIKYLHYAKSSAYLSMPSFDGETLRIIAINTGDAPAILMAARVESDILPGATKVRLKDERSAYIAPGAQQIAFEVVPPFTGEQAYAESLKSMAPIVSAEIAEHNGKVVSSKSKKPLGLVLLGLMQSDGKVSVQAVPISADDMFRLLQADADRCQSEKRATFENGCIGNGAPD